MNVRLTGLLLLMAMVAGPLSSHAQKTDTEYDYVLLATTKTSTMEKELNQTAKQGYRFAAVMGGETAFAGSELVVIMTKDARAGHAGDVEYKLLATNKTKTMQKELNGAGAEGFRYCGQSVAKTAFGGDEVIVILSRDRGAQAASYEYRLLATRKTKTMQKELKEAGAAGFRIEGMDVGPTSFGGNEVVCILSRTARD